MLFRGVRKRSWFPVFVSFLHLVISTSSLAHFKNVLHFMSSSGGAPFQYWFIFIGNFFIIFRVEWNRQKWKSFQGLHLQNFIHMDAYRSTQPRVNCTLIILKEFAPKSYSIEWKISSFHSASLSRGVKHKVLGPDKACGSSLSAPWDNWACYN